MTNRCDIEGPISSKTVSSNLCVWDSQYGPAKEAFSVFRETICGTFMPWTPKPIGDSFDGRIESVALENGVLGRVRISPIITRKTRSDIAHSTHECIHGNFILSGELKVEQGSQTTFAKPGDLVLHQSFSPVTLTVRQDIDFDNLAFIVPTSHFASINDAEDKFLNALVSKEKMFSVLKDCLGLLSNNLHIYSSDELFSLFEACIALLPLSVGRQAELLGGSQPISGAHLLKDIFSFIEENLSDQSLSPRITAKRFGVSKRYIHKLFADYGTTFSSYVTTKRLEHVRSELVALNHKVPISVLAYRWGFREISTFNRLFKERFGCTPLEML